MARKIAPLTNANLLNPKPKDKSKDKDKPSPIDKPFTMYDGDGLFILVNPATTMTDPKTGKDKTVPGSKLWRFKYRIAGKEKLMSFGAYPEVSLTAAREKRKDAREKVAAGTDPLLAKKAKIETKSGDVENSFEVNAREYHKSIASGGDWSTDHAEIKLKNWERDLFPWIGNRPIADITPEELLGHLERVVDRGAIETAHRLRYDCQRIFAYAIVKGRAKINSALLLSGILPKIKKGHYAAITDPKEAGLLLNAIDHYIGTLVVRSALKLAPLFFVRPGELRHMEWSEIDFDDKRWNVPGEKMKMEIAHIVPLCRQAMAVLKDLEPFSRHRSKYVFPGLNSNSKCMSENAVNNAIRAMGYEKDQMCGHGFRAMARTIARERLKIEAEYLEIQLSHKTKAPNGSAYDRVAFLDERILVMQQWADYLDQLRAA
jgi:integrase